MSIARMTLGRGGLSMSIARMTDHAWAQRTHWDGERRVTRIYEGDLVLTVDMDALMEQMGPLALASKGKRATARAGAVKVKAFNVTSKIADEE